MQYKSTEGAHWKAMKTKSVELSDRLKSLVEQAGELGDAPDSFDRQKTTKHDRTAGLTNAF